VQGAFHAAEEGLGHSLTPLLLRFPLSVAEVKQARDKLTELKIRLTQLDAEINAVNMRLALEDDAREIQNQRRKAVGRTLGRGCRCIIQGAIGEESAKAQERANFPPPH
jgi:hypothetical protein